LGLIKDQKADWMNVPLDIVIVNWNSGQLLARCVASLQQATVSGVLIGAVVVVDNASHDGSWLIDAPIDLQVVVIRNVRNLGFAAACNQGARSCREPYVLFLNPDTELEATSLSGPLRRLVSDEKGQIGIIGIALVDNRGERQRNTARFPTPARMIGQALGLDRWASRFMSPQFMMEWDHQDTREVDQVPGAFMLMRRQDFERLGGFDERFFLYMEDVDLSVRVRSAGQVSLYIHDCTARHTGGGTTGAIRDKRLFYLLRSRVLYARKHFGTGGCALAVIAVMLIEPIARLSMAVILLDLKEVKAIFRAMNWLWRA
jgi:GT2 family glycosyltransferase